jgi:hypothetical protein
MADLAGNKVAFLGYTGSIEPHGAGRIAVAFRCVNSGRSSYVRLGGP